MLVDLLPLGILLDLIVDLVIRCVIPGISGRPRLPCHQELFANQRPFISTTPVI